MGDFRLFRLMPCLEPLITPGWVSSDVQDQLSLSFRVAQVTILIVEGRVLCFGEETVGQEHRPENY